MDPDDPEVQKMLPLARAKAESLLAELRKQFADLQANPPALAPDQLKQGRAAMQNAIASTERMLAALNGAMEIAAEFKKDAAEDDATRNNYLDN